MSRFPSEHGTEQIAPKWKVWVYSAINLKVRANPASMRNRHTLQDFTLMSDPWELPLELVESIEYRDSIDYDSNFRIRITNGNEAVIRSTNGTKHFLSEVLEIGAIIAITENNKLKFAGNVSKIQDISDASGDQTMSVSGGGLDQKLRNLKIFLDQTDASSPSITRSASSVAADPRGSFTATIEDLLAIANQFRTPRGLVEAIADKSMDLLEGAFFGGYDIDELISTSNLSRESYTQGFIHAMSFLQSAQIGEEFNFWNLMDQVATAPLYELFMHYDQSVDFMVQNPFLQISKKGFGGMFDVGDGDNPEVPLGNLVFRQTPFIYLDRIMKIPGIHQSIPESIIRRHELTEDERDIFTGVHVTMGIADNRASSALYFPPEYSPELVGKFGKKVLQVKLDGVGVPEEISSSAGARTLVTQLKAVQTLLMETFGKGEYITSGTLYCDYYREVCKGQFVDILSHADMARDPSLQTGADFRPAYERYYDGEADYSAAPRFYVTAINVNINPKDGENTMDLDVKWGAKGYRKTVETRIARNTLE